MIARIIALACLLLVASLPLSRTKFGQTLRSWSLFLFLIAFLPSLFFGLFTSATSTVSSGDTNPLAVLGGLVLLSGLAWGVLEIRRRLNRPRGDAWGDYVGRRSTGKRLVARDERDEPPPI